MRAGAAPARSTDLRLAAAALAAWLADLAVVELLGAARGAIVVTVLAAGSVALGLAAAVAAPDRERRRRRLRRAAGLVAVAGVIAGGAVLRVDRAHERGLAALASSRVAVTADLAVTGDPVRVVTPVRGHTLASVHVAARVSAGRVGSGGCTGCPGQRVLVMAGDDPSWRALVPSQRLRVAGTLRPTAAASAYSAILVTRAPPEAVTAPSRAQQVAARVRHDLRSACASAPGPAAGLLPGLVDGDTAALSPAVAADFTTAGMTHLVAVSGENVALALAAALGAARWLGAGRRALLPLGMLTVLALVVLARPGPSVLRAAVTAGIALTARAAGRPHAALPVLAAAVLVLLAGDPFLGTSRGFQLSVAATAGIVLLATPIQDGIQRLLPDRVGPPVAAALGVPAAAQLACAPIIATFAGQVSLVAVPANALAAPAVGPATVVGILAACLSPVLPAVAHPIAWVAGWPALWLVGVARLAAGLPAASVPWPTGLAGGLLLVGITAGAASAVRLGRARHRPPRAGPTEPGMEGLPGLAGRRRAPATADPAHRPPAAVPGWPP